MNLFAYRLKARHAELDRLIADERRRPAPDWLTLQPLKRRKLRIKERLSALSTPLAA